ncbi:MAG TPA: hypothetical protein VNM72_11630 [Blastocatellia bacterium]|nr:hypothetical protein [Blastocatellia bacterium]
MSRRGAERKDGDAVVQRIREALGQEWIPALYEREILTRRTRRYVLNAPGPGSRVEITHTLLGIELKIGRRRILVPDLATARYLAVFARIGIGAVAIPYDITVISSLADRLESSFQRTMLLADHFSAGGSRHRAARLKSRLLSDIRAALARLGAGARYPTFDLIATRRP